MTRICLVAVAFGILLRVLAVVHHDVPRGDVVLDVGVVRSLGDGEGFAAGFERGIARVAGRQSPVPPQGWADQHAPLWPLVGAALAPLAGSALGGLQLGSWLAALAGLVLVARMAERMTVGRPTEGAGLLAAAIVAVSFVAIDAAGSGALYGLQAALVLALVESLAGPRPRIVLPGLVLGALAALNHQCLVLLPVPLIVALVGSEPGRRAVWLRPAALATGLALLVQVPWWWRNLALFGDPFHSVNDLYFLHRAGVPLHFAVEDGLPVLRFDDDLGPRHVLAACLSFLQPNVLYVLTTGLFVWPGLIGIAAAGLPAAVAGGVLRRDRRLLALLVVSGALLAVSVLWPATKLRYLVPLVPPGVLLGLVTLSRAPARFDRWGAALVGAIWLGALVLTRDDLLGGGGDSRPLRWTVLAGLGAAFLAAPLLLHLLGLRDRHGQLGPLTLMLVSGLLVSPILAAIVAFGPGPGTAYHAAPFAPDFFGQRAEVRAAERSALLGQLMERARERGARRVAGPIQCLAWEQPALLEVPSGLGAFLVPTLEAWLDRDAADHVIVSAADALMLNALATEPGDTLMDGRLVLVERAMSTDGSSGWLLCAVAA